MAKTAKMKSDPSSNPRSRTARRSAAAAAAVGFSPSSPPISHTTDSANNRFIPTFSSQSQTKQHKTATINGGIVKNKQQQRRRGSKDKMRTRQQRLRQERGSLRAEEVLGKLDRKVEGSLRRRKMGRERRRAWEEVNGTKGNGSLGVGGVDVDEDEDQSRGGAVGGEEGAAMGLKDGWVDESNVSAVVNRVEPADEENGAQSEDSGAVHLLMAEVDGAENEADKIT